MEHEHQERYYELGKSYWWLAGKYRIIDDVVRRAFRPTLRTPGSWTSGCGPGNLLDFLAPARTRPTAPTTRRTRCASARNAAIAGSSGPTSTRCPLQAESFDLVTCIDVLEHLADDRQRRGRALPDPATLGRRSRRQRAGLPGALGRPRHALRALRRYTTAEVRAELEEAGFEVGKLTYFEPLFFVAPLDLPQPEEALRPGRRHREARRLRVAAAARQRAPDPSSIAAERFALRHDQLPVRRDAPGRRPRSPAAAEQGHPLNREAGSGLRGGSGGPRRRSRSPTPSSGDASSTSGTSSSTGTRRWSPSFGR